MNLYRSSPMVRKVVHYTFPLSILAAVLILWAFVNGYLGDYMWDTTETNLTTFAVNTVFTGTLLVAAGSLAGSALLFGQDLRYILHTNDIPVRDVILDVYPLVLVIVFLLL